MKKTAAFTLIEVLVVIAVFSIGILATFHWMTQTFKNESYADTQIKSAFFAREWIELMFNLRDANYHKELPWNCIFNPNAKISKDWIEDDEKDKKNNPYCSGYFSTWMILKIWIWSWSDYIQVQTWELKDDFAENFSWFQIYYHSWVNINNEIWFIYNHTWTEEQKTRFARYLVITWVTENGKTLPTGSILKIESHVLYERMWTTWEKIMETFIWNYEF